jgi:hypothetical protein
MKMLARDAMEIAAIRHPAALAVPKTCSAHMNLR